MVEIKENDDAKNTEYSYNGVKIELELNIAESKEHIGEDYKVIENADMEKIIKEKFLPWFKGNQYADADDNKIYEGLKLIQVDYVYHRIVEKYSPTGETDNFGEFSFMFESCSDYTKDMLEAVSMVVVINKGKIVNVYGYDV